MKKVKIYGERNTGTNYLSKLISINFECELVKGTVPINIDKVFRRLSSKESLRDFYFSITKNNLGWKHRELDETFLKSTPSNISIAFITLTKNPYSWLLSMYNRPYHMFNKKKLSFEEFLVEKCVPLGRECKTGYYENPVDMWNKKNTSYINLAKQFEVELLTYEDLLFNPLEQLIKLKAKFNFIEKEGYPINYMKSTKDDDKNADFYLKYYGEELWRSKLSEENINVINKHLAEDIVDYFGYSFI
ncbi:MAG: hypothetical protein CMO82_11855 [Winogradskyella sp.]|nr:hypothetical protein [Winogradskyella sp.]|tara:strand:- start:3338 stop:4075 length:738 start_codon:yes stop_codon:yes gene_type:complete